jgi:hypothetical protein
LLGAGESVNWGSLSRPSRPTAAGWARPQDLWLVDLAGEVIEPYLYTETEYAAAAPTLTPMLEGGIVLLAR